jgi:hypothetical protein
MFTTEGKYRVLVGKPGGMKSLGVNGRKILKQITNK